MIIQHDACHTHAGMHTHTHTHAHAAAAAAGPQVWCISMFRVISHTLQVKKYAYTHILRAINTMFNIVYALKQP